MRAPAVRSVCPCRWQPIIINNNNKITRCVLYYAFYTHTYTHSYKHKHTHTHIQILYRKMIIILEFLSALSSPPTICNPPVKRYPYYTRSRCVLTTVFTILQYCPTLVCVPNAHNEISCALRVLCSAMDFIFPATLCTPRSHRGACHLHHANREKCLKK